MAPRSRMLNSSQHLDRYVDYFYTITHAHIQNNNILCLNYNDLIVVDTKIANQQSL